jgi:hypothetical protein
MYSSCCGLRKSRSSVELPFSNVHIWHNFRMQQYSAQDNHVILPARTVQALPPSATMPFGRRNIVLVNDTDGSTERTANDSSGEYIIDVSVPRNSSKLQVVELYKSALFFLPCCLGSTMTPNYPFTSMANSSNSQHRIKRKSMVSLCSSLLLTLTCSSSTNI